MYHVLGPGAAGYHDDVMGLVTVTGIVDRLFLLLSFTLFHSLSIQTL